MKDWLLGAKGWARRLKRDVVALWIAARDPRTPVLAKSLSEKALREVEQPPSA